MQQLKCLLEKHGLLGSHCAVPRQNPKSKGLLVKLGLFWPGADDMTRLVGATVAKAVGEGRPRGIAQNSVIKLSLLESQSRVQRENPISLCPLIKRGLLESPIRSATTESDIAMSSGEAVGPEQMAWTVAAHTAAVTSAGQARRLGIQSGAPP